MITYKDNWYYSYNTNTKKQLSFKALSNKLI